MSPSHCLARYAAPVLIALACVQARAGAASITPIYQFTGGADGATPWSGLTPDPYGNVYGTTQNGGISPSCEFDSGCGTVFKLDAAGHFSTIHTFAGLELGQNPITGLSIMHGRLYGSAQGTLFSLDFSGANYTILHQLTQAEGAYQIGLLRPESATGGGFGLGSSGGRYGSGTLFYLATDHSVSVLHDFGGPKSNADGKLPNALVEDRHGNLFGSTIQGGNCAEKTSGCGIVFEYVPKTRAYAILHTFSGTDDGDQPLLGAAGPDGTLYGVTENNRTKAPGILFSLTPKGESYSFAILAPVKGQGNDRPITPPTLAHDGALIGGTIDGGNYKYANGKFQIFYAGVDPYGPNLAPSVHPGSFLATSRFAGTACSQPPYASGCGFIYYGQH